MIECRASGILYRNPKPYLRAVNAWHPSVVVLGGGELLASFDLGQGAESMDYARYLSRSKDGGAHWTEPVRMFEDPVQPTTHSVRLSRMRDGTLVAMGSRMHRPDPEQGLVNRANFGYTPMDLINLASNDDGRTWDGPRVIEPPLVGPGFECCHSVVELADGRWLYPTSTWRGWDGDAPNGVIAIALVSHDRGRTWPQYLRVFHGGEAGVVYFEQSLIELADGRLVAIAWAFHEPSGKSRPNVFAISDDGRTFAPVQPVGLNGETAKIMRLDGRRVLCLYRRTDEPGLWAAVAEIGTDRWDILSQLPLWQGAASGMTGQGNTGDELSALKFGFPHMVRLPDGDIFAAFWCCEDAVYQIRWLRLAVA